MDIVGGSLPRVIHYVTYEPSYELIHPGSESFGSHVCKIGELLLVATAICQICMQCS